MEVKTKRYYVISWKELYKILELANPITSVHVDFSKEAILIYIED